MGKFFGRKPRRKPFPPAAPVAVCRWCGTLKPINAWCTCPEAVQAQRDYEVGTRLKLAAIDLANAERITLEEATAKLREALVTDAP